MSQLHTEAQIQNYEEHWQKQCYFKSADGVHYIHCCEICHTTNKVLRIPGGHYVCISCKKKLKIPKRETIIRVGNAQKENHQKYFPKGPFHPSDPSKIEREKTWKKIIMEDHMIELCNQNFNY